MPYSQDPPPRVVDKLLGTTAALLYLALRSSLSSGPSLCDPANIPNNPTDGAGVADEEEDDGETEIAFVPTGNGVDGRILTSGISRPGVVLADPGSSFGGFTGETSVFPLKEYKRFESDSNIPPPDVFGLDAVVP